MIELALLKNSIWESIKGTFETVISLPVENVALTTAIDGDILKIIVKIKSK